MFGICRFGEMVGQATVWDDRSMGGRTRDVLLAKAPLSAGQP